MPARSRRLTFPAGVLLLMFASPADAQLSVAATSRPAALAPPPALTFRVNTTSDAARAAFDAAYDAYLELDVAAAADGFRQAHRTDPGMQLAAAFEMTLRGRSPAIAAEVRRLSTLNGSPTIIESLQFLSIAERNNGRAVVANQLLAAAARAAYGDPRLLAEYHLWLPIGNTARVAIARTLRDHDPASYRYHAYVALALTAPEDSTEALRSMVEALQHGAERPFAHYAAGELLARLGRNDEAIAHYGHALQLNGAYYLAQLRRGRTALSAERYEAARRDFEQVQQRITYAPDLGLARRAFALSYLHQGDIDQANRAMQEAAATFERENADGERWIAQLGLAHSALAMMAAARKDHPAVERHLAAQRGVQGEDSGSAASWATIAWALAGDAARAREALTAYEAMVPAATSAPARAMVLVAEGRHAEALAAAGTSTNSFALLAGYHAFTALGRSGEAHATLAALLALPDQPPDGMGLQIARYLYARSMR